MPFYIFKKESTGEVKEVFFRMNDEKVFIDDSGEEWKRVFTVPQAVVDPLESSINPHSMNDWMNKTSQKKGTTVGEMWDLSTELSKKRAKDLGRDPLKEKKIQEHKQKYGSRPMSFDNGGNSNTDD